jgi:hypothetical protein
MQPVVELGAHQGHGRPSLRSDGPARRQLAEVLVEHAAGNALVGQDDRAFGQRALAGGVIQQRLGDLAFTQPWGWLGTS